MDRELQLRTIYNGLDFFKVIAAIFVVLLHAIETTDHFWCGIKFVFTRFAVPFFFIASGFFFYKGLSKAEDKKAYFLKYEKNILKIFFVWGVLIYAPVTISTYLKEYSNVGIVKFCFLLFRRVFVIGSGPFWYLVALIWSAAFIYFCFSKGKDVWIYIGITVGFCLQVAYSCFQGVLSNILIFKYLFRTIYYIFSWEFNFIMYGIPFMGIGYLLSKKEIKVTSKKAKLILVFATCIRVIEYLLPQIFPGNFWEENEISFAFIVQAVAFFMLAKGTTFNIKKETSLTLRQISSCIYFSHAIFLYNILNPLLDKFTTLPTYAPILILPKVMVALVLCMLLFIIVKKIDNKHLNVLING